MSGGFLALHVGEVPTCVVGDSPTRSVGVSAISLLPSDRERFHSTLVIRRSLGPRPCPENVMSRAYLSRGAGVD
jgi:hypothetical protein